MIVVATDAPLDARNLKRLAKRAFLGLGKTGGIASNGSGDYVIAFSTAKDLRVAYQSDSKFENQKVLRNDEMSPLFMAANEAKCGGSVLLMPDGKVFDTHSGYKVGDSEEEVMLRTPSLSVKSLLEFKSYLVELLNERSDRRLAIDKDMGKAYKPQPMTYSADTYSGVVPHIGVKNV